MRLKTFHLNRCPAPAALPVCAGGTPGEPRPPVQPRAACCQAVDGVGAVCQAPRDENQRMGHVKGLDPTVGGGGGAALHWLTLPSCSRPCRYH